VQAEILTAGEDVAELVRSLRELVPDGESVSSRVAEIIAAVRAGGDEAVSGYTARFDTGGVAVESLQVPVEVLQGAAAELDPHVRLGLKLAIANVRSAARAGLRDDRLVELPAAEVTIREAPVDSAAVYVPGGRAPYPSTVVMGVVTAQAAGVEDIAVCAPPGRDGEVDAVILAACELT
jgi:histidinol dehydrogenase